MQGLKARVVNGRLIVDQPTALPEGTELDLTIVEPGDDLDDEERAELHAALARAWESARIGNCSPAEDLLKKLRTDQ
jgi:hypothetical protein